MKLLRLPLSVSLVALLIFTLRFPANAQYPRWLHGATGFARAIELQRELNVSLVLYFYTDRCSDCRTLDTQYLPAPSVHRALQRSIAVRINPDYGTEERQIADRYGVTNYPAFLILDHESAPPRDVQPFHREGNHLTPEQFARACEKLMTFLPIAPKVMRNEPREPPDRDSIRAVRNATRQTRGAQIVEVGSGSASSPAIIKINPLPAIDVVLSRYVDAIGGREAHEQLKSRVITGKLELSGSDAWAQLNVYAKAPNKSLTVMNVEPTGQVKHGFDGRMAWSVGDTIGTHTLSGAALSKFSPDTAFYRETRLSELYRGIRLIGTVKEKDRELYLVEGFPLFGREETMYFDIQSGLLIGRDLMQQTPLGPMPVQMRYSDWREVDGVKLPFKIVQSMPNLKFVFTVREIKHNLPLEDRLFEKP